MTDFDVNERTIKSKEADSEYNRKLEQRLALLARYEEEATFGYTDDFSTWLTPKLFISLGVMLVLVAMLYIF